MVYTCDIAAVYVKISVLVNYNAVSAVNISTDVDVGCTALVEGDRSAVRVSCRNFTCNIKCAASGDNAVLVAFNCAVDVCC